MREYCDVFKSGTAKVTAHGIIFNKIAYSCETAIREQWYQKAANETWMISVFVDLWSDEYLLLPLKNGTLSLAYKLDLSKLTTDGDTLEYQELIRELKRKRLRLRKRGGR